MHAVDKLISEDQAMLPDIASKSITDLRVQLAHALSDHKSLEALLLGSVNHGSNSLKGPRSATVSCIMAREKLSALQAHARQISLAAASLDSDLALLEVDSPELPAPRSSSSPDSSSP